MDSPFITILKTLELYGVGQFTDIAPTLLSIYTLPNNSDNNLKQETSHKIISFLTIMEQEELLIFGENRFANLGNGHSGRINWLTDIKILATIGTQGLKYLTDDRNQKMVEQVNQSVIDTNKATKDFIPVQKNISIASVIISFVALAFSIIVLFRDNEKEVRTLNNTLQMQLQELDKKLKSLKRQHVDTVAIKK